MKVCVYGLGHQGATTAACLATRGLEVSVFDPDPAAAAALAAGRAPWEEPGVAELWAQGVAGGRLRPADSLAAAAAGALLLWAAFELESAALAPVVLGRIRESFPVLPRDAVVLVSSQLPVGSMNRLERDAAAARPDLACAYCPENLRIGSAVATFLQAERFVVGLRGDRGRPRLEELFTAVGRPVVWMGIESAEMSKHALNSFLAMTVVYANELAGLCGAAGADSLEVERALRSDPRVGPRAYLRAGSAFSGHTLRRDLECLLGVGERAGIEVPLLSAILPSNESARLWAARRLESRLESLEGRRVAVLGLAYKPGTASTRGSEAVELCRRLADHGASVRVFDPLVGRLPEGMGAVALCRTAEEALDKADAAVIALACPEFSHITADMLARRMAAALVLDPGRVCQAALGADPRIEYIVFGR